MGTLYERRILNDATLARFWSKVEKTPTCWLWTAAKDDEGYGIFDFDRKKMVASRVSWFIEHGVFPKHFACHDCDVPSCVRPDHLYDGTQKENLADAKRKGRLSNGDRHYSRLHPERMARGERHGSRTHPEALPRGDNHHSHLRPECVARGARHSSRTHPERIARGEQAGGVKLTACQVNDIRKIYSQKGTTQTALARRFKVSQSAISAVITRATWTHV